MHCMLFYVYCNFHMRLSLISITDIMCVCVFIKYNKYYFISGSKYKDWKDVGIIQVEARLNC